jgi:cytoskeletal protein RodZ
LLGAPVFAKGHLRKYAELVGVPVDDVLADYYELNRSAGAPPVVGPVRKFKRDISLGPWISVTVIIVIILGATYWFFTRNPAISLTESTSVVQVSNVPDANETQSQQEAAESTVMDSEPESLRGADDMIPQTVVASLSPSAGEASPFDEESSPLPQVNVELVYSGDCWTEVSDASGRSLFYDLGTEGRVAAAAWPGSRFKADSMQSLINTGPGREAAPGTNCGEA